MNIQILLVNINGVEVHWGWIAAGIAVLMAIGSICGEKQALEKQQAAQQTAQMKQVETQQRDAVFQRIFGGKRVVVVIGTPFDDYANEPRMELVGLLQRAGASIVQMPQHITDRVIVETPERFRNQKPDLILLGAFDRTLNRRPDNEEQIDVYYDGRLKIWKFEHGNFALLRDWVGARHMCNANVYVPWALHDATSTMTVAV